MAKENIRSVKVALDMAHSFPSLAKDWLLRDCLGQFGVTGLSLNVGFKSKTRAEVVPAAVTV